MKMRAIVLCMAAIVAACSGETVDSGSSGGAGSAGTSSSNGGSGGSGGRGAGGSQAGQAGSGTPGDDASAGAGGIGGASGEVDSGQAGESSTPDGCPATKPVDHTPCDVTHVCKYPPACSNPYSGCLFCNCVSLSGSSQWICQTAG